MSYRLTRSFLLFTLLLLSSRPAILAQRTLIHCGALLDGVKKELQPEMTITVERQ